MNGEIGEMGEFTYCPHGRVRELVVCRLCCESALCQTRECVELDRKAKRARAAISDATVPCEHSSEKRRCKICKGSWICAHGLNKVYCADCDGRRLCQACHRVILPRCWEICRECKRQEAGQAEARRSRDKRSARAVLCI